MHPAGTAITAALVTNRAQPELDNWVVANEPGGSCGTWMLIEFTYPVSHHSRLRVCLKMDLPKNPKDYFQFSPNNVFSWYLVTPLFRHTHH